MTLTELRTIHRWSQGQLARAIGVSPPFISMVEAGKRELPAERAVEIGRSLGYDGEALASVVGALVLAHRGAS